MMKLIDLTKTIKPYKSGWIAVDKKQKVVVWAESFNKIMKKIKKAKDIFLMPASDNYSGFITRSNA